MRKQQTTTIGTQTTATNPANLAIKMESLNLEAIEKKRETELQAEILSGSLWQEGLKKQLQECSRNRRQASATATSVDGGTSCRGATASRCLAGPEDDNTDDWQAELLHDVDEETLEKLDKIAADIDEMASRERWLFCRSCKSWHTVPCSKFLMLSILGLLLQTRPINATEIQGKGDYSIADLHGVAVFENRYDAVLDIIIEMPFLRLRAEMGKLRTAMEKASKEYDQKRVALPEPLPALAPLSGLHLGTDPILLAFSSCVRISTPASMSLFLHRSQIIIAFSCRVQISTAASMSLFVHRRCVVIKRVLAISLRKN
jgi:hypothetical protein